MGLCPVSYRVCGEVCQVIHERKVSDGFRGLPLLAYRERGERSG